MSNKRFVTNGYYIYDQYKEDKWLCNEVEAQEIVTVMNNLNTKARERSIALSVLQKKYDKINEENEYLKDEVRYLEDKGKEDRLERIRMINHFNQRM